MAFPKKPEVHRERQQYPRDYPVQIKDSTGAGLNGVDASETVHNAVVCRATGRVAALGRQESDSARRPIMGRHRRRPTRGDRNASDVDDKNDVRKHKPKLQLTNYYRTTALLSVKSILIQACLICVLCHTGYAKPSTKPLNTMPKRESDSTISAAVDYMSKFGYLAPSSLESGNLRTEEQLRKAIRVMQRFGGIPETGEVDAETRKLMKRKRCGMRDLLGNADRVRRYALQGQKWTKNRLTWSISEQTYSYIEKNMARRTISKALRVWSDAANLTFTEVLRPDADIMVSFRKGYHEDGYPFDGKGSVLAHAFFPGEGIGGDAHFDAEETWVATDRELQGDAINLFSVAAHEFGHSLGLSHSSIQGSLMFPYYQHIKDDFELPYDDTVGIQQLYGPKNPVKWGSMPPMSPTRPHQPPKTKPTRTPVRSGNPSQNPSQNPDRNPNTGYVPDEPEDPEAPMTCSTSVDAVSTIRGEIFFFKDWYFWRRDDRGLKTKDPVGVEIFWYKLPTNLGKFDAVYERQNDSKILFFSGQKYWLFNANNPEPGYPRPLTDLGLPRDLKRLDAAIVWGHNGKTYFFSGNQYWRFDEARKRVDPDYPRNMALWKGVPTDMDAAFQHRGITYFFKGLHYWKFDDKNMRTTSDSPKLIAETWFDCPPQGYAGLPPIKGASRSTGSSATILNGRTRNQNILNTVISVTLLYVCLWFA